MYDDHRKEAWKAKMLPQEQQSHLPEDSRSDETRDALRERFPPDTDTLKHESFIPAIPGTFRGVKLPRIAELYKEIFEAPSFGKKTRSRYYNIVHAFRERFPRFKQVVGNPAIHQQASEAAIEKMNSPQVSSLISPPLLHQIEKLSSIETYLQVRRANRSRVHGQMPLSDTALTKLSEEIRAAMIWRHEQERMYEKKELP